MRFSDGEYEILIFKSGKMVINGVKDEKSKKHFARYVGI
ncbi:MAG: hypothetical protein J7K58_02270 [Euryarchaeota archaeon]|nr:hypothetical protein [Euryarchaeota archaeon]